MLYYYRKVRKKGKYKDKYLKVCVDDSKPEWRVVDAFYVDEIDKTETVIYKKPKTKGTKK